MEQKRQKDFIYREVFENREDTTRQCAQIDLNWRFFQCDVDGAERIDFDDSNWRLLNVPHDWSIEGDYDHANPSGGSGAFLPTGIGWYRKTIQIPAEWRNNRRISLLFDGVFCNSTVYANGEQVGGMNYGWLSFSCDVTKQLKERDSVTIAVKVDNSVQPAARWYTGSGIYSHVWILSTEEIHVAENGVYITTPAEHKNAPDGTVCLETKVQNESDTDVEITLKSTIYRTSDHKKEAQIVDRGIVIAQKESAVLLQRTKVSDPLLWSTETPALYYVKTEIISEGKRTDDCTTEFGFRSISYDEQGLYINGENVKLRGVSNHWALGAFGAAQPTSVIRYKINLMKTMGANCIRTSHNACPPEFYRLCNEMGMMVMDELFEGERGKVAGDYGTRFFGTNWKTDVEFWIKRDRNHPCVIVWSIGNETGSNNDNTGISAYIKNFDTTRPTTGSWIFTGVDIPGANGASEQKTFQKPIEGLPLIATEAPHTHAVRGAYRTRTWFRGNFSDGEANGKFKIPHLTDKEIFAYDWEKFSDSKRILPSDYDNAVSQISVRKHWTLTRDNAWRLGEFRWTGFDYLGEANYVLGGWPYRMFHSGAVDTALFPKDMYYLYQSMWRKEPILHLLPSWTHPTMEEGTEIPVWVYSNCEKVELFLNGASLGTVDRGPVEKRTDLTMQFDWLVPYTPGTITAIGYDNEGNEILRETKTTADTPAELLLEKNIEELPKDLSEIAHITVKTVDETGTLYPYGENRIYFHVDGPAYLKGLDNGSPNDTENHVGNNRKAFMGMAKAFVAPTQDNGDVTVTCAAILGEKRQLTSDLVRIDVQQLSLRGTAKNHRFEVYYTLDNSLPTKDSTRYIEAFSTEKESTVRAAVYSENCNEPLFLMEERFGKEEGMYWAKTGGTCAENVFPAADAEISGEAIHKANYGYDERYINFGNKPGAATYTVTAEEDDYGYLAVCYNNGSGTVGDCKEMEIRVNGEGIGSYQFFYNGGWDQAWSYRILRIPFHKGKNTVCFASPLQSGVNLRELIYIRNSDVMFASDGTPTENSEETSVSTAFTKSAINLGSEGGELRWKISDRPSGIYRMALWYSTPKGSLREISCKINGADVAVWSVQRVSADFGSAWGFCEKEVHLAPGTNVLSITLPKGGHIVNAIVLTPIHEDASTVCSIRQSCSDQRKLSAENGVPVATENDIESNWKVITNANGLTYLTRDGKLLVSDGNDVFLTDEEVCNNAKWRHSSEMEDFEYLVHHVTGKVLSVTEAGTLCVDPIENHNEEDRVANRAYWKITPIK